jgi:hypothetical protein
MSETKRPKVNSESQKELDKAEVQFKEFDEQIQTMTLDRMNSAPKHDAEPQTKLSQSEIEKSKEIYLKPKRFISSVEKFNEKFRADYEFAREYVYFTAENKEIIGEDLDLWTKPFPGLSAENWIVPVNKPVWGPRYLAEQIKKAKYHRLTMRDMPTQQSGGMQFYGAIGVDTTIQRLDAHPVSQRKSFFMGENGFSSKKIA